MGEHYNLYYILLEDQRMRPLPAQRSEEIRKSIIKFFKNKSSPEDRAAAFTDAELLRITDTLYYIPQK